MEVTKRGGVTIFNDSYNAAELSTIASLKAFAKHKSPRKIALIGQMLELGKFSEEAHINVADMR